MSRITLIDRNHTTLERRELLDQIHGAFDGSATLARRNTMKQLSIACALTLGLAFMASASAMPVQASQSAVSTAASTAPKLQHTLDSLLRGHNVTTRDYALAVHAGNKANENKATKAVLANAKQIAGVVAHFYGKAAGDGMLKLLADHWAGVKALTDAIKAGNTTGEQKAMSDSASNAIATAKFLAGANPNWSEAALQGALMMHGNDHKIQIDEMMSNAPRAQQAKSWAEMQHHMDMIANVLADGITKQFPEKAHAFR